MTNYIAFSFSTSVAFSFGTLYATGMRIAQCQHVHELDLRNPSKFVRNFQGTSDQFVFFEAVGTGCVQTSRTPTDFIAVTGVAKV